jgi:hypothetical protein
MPVKPVAMAEVPVEAVMAEVPVKAVVPVAVPPSMATPVGLSELGPPEEHRQSQR